jgi:hypothetical protein
MAMPTLTLRPTPYALHPTPYTLALPLALSLTRCHGHAGSTGLRAHPA